MAKCKFCNKEIVWLKEGKKNVPVEGDGGKHECEQMKASLKSAKTIDPKSLSPEELARYAQMPRSKVYEQPPKAHRFCQLPTRLRLK